MKNLNIEKATTLKTVKSVISKFIYSLCAALFLLMCSLSTNAQTGRRPTPTDAIPLDPLELGVVESHYSTYYNAAPGLIDSLGGNGNDLWMRIYIGSTCYFRVYGGSTDNNLDGILYLYDSSGNLLTYNDDDPNNPSTSWVSPHIEYLVSPGYYYVMLDGTDYKPGKTGPFNKNGGVQLSFYVY